LQNTKIIEGIVIDPSIYEEKSETKPRAWQADEHKRFLEAI
jgi:hypothetical protein